MHKLVLSLLLFFPFLTVFGQKQFSYEPIFNTLKPKTGNVALLLGFYHEGKCESMYIGIQNGAVSIKKYPYIVVPQENGFVYAGTIPHQVQVADHINTTESSRVDFQGLWVANNALDIPNKQKEPILAVANIYYFTRNIINFVHHITLPPKKEGAIRGKEDVELFSFGGNTFKDKLIDYIPENILENKFANTNIDVRDLGFVLYRKQGNVYIHGYKKVKEIPDGWNTGEEQEIELGVAPNTLVTQNTLPFGFSTLKELNPAIKDVWLSPSQNYIFLQEGEELVIIDAILKKEIYRVAFPKGCVVLSEWATTKNEIKKWSETLE